MIAYYQSAVNATQNLRVGTVVYGTRKGIPCIWYRYKTQLFLYNVTYTVSYRDMGIFKTASGQTNNVTKNNSYEINEQRTLINCYPGSVIDHYPTFVQARAKARSRGTNGKEAVIHCN